MHSDCQVDGIFCGKGSAKSVRVAKEQASYQALVYFGRA